MFIMNKMLLKVLIAMLLAIIAGLATGANATLFGVPYLSFYNLIGQLFLNALSLVVVPLVAASIITGIAKMGNEQSFGSLGLKTLGYFVLTSLLAILVGLFTAFILSPGTSTEPLPVTSGEALIEIKNALQGGAFQKIEVILLKIIPGNIISAASQGQMLGIIYFQHALWLLQCPD